MENNRKGKYRNQSKYPCKYINKCKVYKNTKQDV